MKLRAIVIIVLIIVSLLPVYMLYQYLGKIMRPRESMGRFAGWLLAIFAMILTYTFLLAVLIRLLFPGA